MRTFWLIFFILTIALPIISALLDLTDSRFGIKSWYRNRRSERPLLATIDRWSPHRFWKTIARLIARFPRTSITIFILLAFHAWLHLANPYAAITFFKSPYTTRVEPNGSISYQQVYKPIVLADPASDILGYYRSGFLIVQNTLVGGAPINKPSANGIISEIHRRRFDPNKPYLISGDQFSVLYPRNLGVFYNQLLDPNTAQSKTDWENRQRIYLQSVLFAIDGLSVGDTPKTTLVPVGPRTVASTTVHPGDIGSDAVYGTLFALDKMLSESKSVDSKYQIQTNKSAKRILSERSEQLKHMVSSYVRNVRDPISGLVRTDIHLSSARDGASRKSSFYDNVVLWKTLSLANSLGLLPTSEKELTDLKNDIKSTFWNEQKGYYNNDQFDDGFSSDWLIGYVTDFFDLENAEDLERTKRSVKYVSENNLANPLPIKYQIGKPKDAPWVIRTFVPNYGGDAIWSYWGAEYMTLLVNLANKTNDDNHLKQVEEYRSAYDKAIVRDGGFAETYSPDGKFLQKGLYKSIRITGWVVQYEHAIDLLEKARAEEKPTSE